MRFIYLWESHIWNHRLSEPQRQAYLGFPGFVPVGGTTLALGIRPLVSSRRPVRVDTPMPEPPRGLPFP